MKKLILLYLLYGSLTGVYAQNYYIYINGEKRYFEISPNKALMQFEEETPNTDIKRSVQKGTSLQISSITEIGHNSLKMISFSNSDKAAVMQFVNQWKGKKSVVYSGCVFVDKQGKETAALMNRIIVRLKKESDYQVLLNNITYYDIDSIEQNEFDSKTYLLKLNYSSSKNAMQIANELYEKGLFEYAEPDLLLFIKYATNDAYFSQQWALNNTGQFGGTNGVDIKANQAWNITTGSPNIKIAILDSGVDFTHPDLVNNLLTGYDAAGGNNNGNQSFMPHGTACAGIVAAHHLRM